jgi:hypothetical protein
MSRPAVDRNRKRMGQIFLVLCCICVLGLLLNICTRLGWFPRLPGVGGYPARWRWATGAAVFFMLAWYMERLGRERTR